MANLRVREHNLHHAKHLKLNFRTNHFAGEHGQVLSLAFWGCDCPPTVILGTQRQLAIKEKNTSLCEGFH